MKSNTIEIDEQKLMDDLKNESSRSFAFHTLISQYQKRIYWHIRKLVITHDDANDLTQDTFVKVWNAIPQFRGDSKIFTWLYRVATNEALMFLRKKKLRYYLPLHNVENELEQKIKSPEYFNGNEAEKLLQIAILKLPAKQRAVFNMKYYDEITYQQMAEITGTSEGALKASYHLATKKIEEFLKASLNH